MQRRRFIAVLAGWFGGAALSPLRAFAQAQTDQPADQAADQIGQVGSMQGTATVTRGKTAAAALKVNDAIYKSDTLETGANSSLSVTFDDESTFNLSADARIVVDDFVYQEGASGNKAAINVARGTVAFVASLVAKTGDMTITTPTASLGIRGTTGVVDVPTQPGGEAKIKLYADADGHVGQIQVFDRQGARLGALTLGASAFEIRRGAGGRFAAIRFAIPSQEAARDRGVVQRLFNSHRIGRQMTIQRQQLRRNFRGPNNPRQRGGQQQNRNQRGPQQQNRNQRGPQQQNRNQRGPQQQNRNLRGPQQPNRGQGQQPQRGGGLRERLRKLNPFSRDPDIGPR